jgi:hypothetical protein
MPSGSTAPRKLRPPDLRVLPRALRHWSRFLKPGGLVDAALAFWDTHLGHPAWQALKTAPPATRDAIRSTYVERVTAAAISGRVPNDTALNFSFGRKPS